jgi:septation ring formation regulator EzrA
MSAEGSNGDDLRVNLAWPGNEAGGRELADVLFQLHQRLDVLAAEQRRLQDLISAVVDAMESEPEAPDAGEQLRPHLERLAEVQQQRHQDLLGRIEERAAATVALQSEDRRAISLLAERSAELAELVNELAETDTTIRDTLSAVRDEVAELRRRPVSLNDATTEALAAAVAERLEAGPVNPPPRR